MAFLDPGAFLRTSRSGTAKRPEQPKAFRFYDRALQFKTELFDLLLGSGLADAPIRLGAHLTPRPDLEPSIPSTVRMHPDSLKRPGCRREGRHQLQCDLQTQVGRMSRRWQVV
jgi:hypothetical protein